MECACQKISLLVVQLSQMINQNTRLQNYNLDSYSFEYSWTWVRSVEAMVIAWLFEDRILDYECSNLFSHSMMWLLNQENRLHYSFDECQLSVRSHPSSWLIEVILNICDCRQHLMTIRAKFDLGNHKLHKILLALVITWQHFQYFHFWKLWA